MMLNTLFSLCWPELDLSETGGQESTSPPLLQHLLLSTIKIVEFSSANTEDNQGPASCFDPNFSIIQHKILLTGRRAELLVEISLRSSVIKILSLLAGTELRLSE